MSILDEKKPQLDPTVWGRSADGSVVIREELAREIRKRARDLLSGIPVRSAFLVGSITGYYYNKNSDIDVNLVVDVDDDTILGLVERARELNGENLQGTTHPINFYVSNESKNLAAFDGVYNLKDDTWTKHPTDAGVDLFAIYDDFKHQFSELDSSIGEIWRSLIDVDILSEALKYVGSREVYRKLQQRLDDLDDAIDSVIDVGDESHRKRIEGFHRQLELAERGMSPYPSLNLIPENVRYKVLERYHYKSFIDKLRKLLEDSGGKIDTPQEVQNVKETLQMFPNKSLSSGFIKKALNGLRI